MSKSILVTGASGQLGSSIKALVSSDLDNKFTFVDVQELDLIKTQVVEEYFANNVFDTIINCAAYTAVDKAETEQNLADKINHLAVKQLAEIAKKQGSTLVHVSTDYVFNGTNYKPYQENDATDPQSVYGLTKLKGEQAFLSVNPKGIIIRTSWVYSEYGSNFVKTMLKLGTERDSLGVIFDQVGMPTYAGDLAKAILDIVLSKENEDILKTGNKVFHYSDEGVCSWYDFAKTIFEMSGIDCQVSAIETKDYPTPAKRPSYSLLNKKLIKNTFGIYIPYWKVSLKNCLISLQEGVKL